MREYTFEFIGLAKLVGTVGQALSYRLEHVVLAAHLHLDGLNHDFREEALHGVLYCGAEEQVAQLGQGLHELQQLLHLTQKPQLEVFVTLVQHEKL